MFSSNISTSKVTLKNTLLSILSISVFVLLLPFVIILAASLYLIAFVLLKVKLAHIKANLASLRNRNGNSRVLDAIKGKDYTVS